MLLFGEALIEQLFDEPFRRVELDDFAVVHDGHAVAEDFGLVHVVRGEDDADATGADFFDELPQVAPSLRIEAGSWFVQEENFGIVHQRGDDTEALLLAAGEIFDIAAGFAAQVDVVEELFGIDPLAVRRGEHLDELGELGFVLKAGRLRLHADHAADFVGMCGHVNAINRGRAAVDGAQGFDHLQRRRFARAVWPENTEDFALLDLKAHAVHRRLIAVAFLEIFDLEDHIRHLNHYNKKPPHT